MTTKLQDEIVAVECDEGQMYQVCLNLLLNAIRACGEGGRVQVLSFRERRNVVIDVLDDGPGISEDSREHLFTPFVSKTEGGVGLGLAIVKRIVEAHGGTVEAGNRENQGARFRARIPGEEQSTRGDRS